MSRSKFPAIAIQMDIVGATGLALRLPDKIAAVRHAPDVTKALRQEVSLVSQGVNEAYGLLQEAKACNLSAPQSMNLALERLKNALMKLSDLIDKCLEREKNGLMNYYRCYRSQRQFETLLEKIGRERASLDSAKATLIFDLGAHIQSDVRFSGCTLGGMIFSTYEAMQYRFDRLETFYQLEYLEALTKMLNKSSVACELIESDDATPTSNRSDTTGSHEIIPTFASKFSGPDSASQSCPSYCCCQCHKSSSFQTQAFLSSIKGPDFSLRMMHVRDPSWSFRCLVLSKDEGMVVKETKRQLEKQEMSVHDVTSDGATALHLAIYSNHPEVSRTLVTKGADIHYKDRFGRSPYMITWERHWSRQDSDKGGLSPNFFADRTRFADFRFTELHQVYLGITNGNFQQLVFNIPRQYIDRGDKQGRTTLSWAAARNDPEAVKRLLQSGADPDKASVDGWTPLHYSAQADGTEALEILLEAKANVDAVTKTGRTALHISCRNHKVPKMMECLLSANVDLEKRTASRFTALEYTLMDGSTKMTKRLLGAGAACGVDSVQLAILYNAHEALRLLLARWNDDDFNQEVEDDDEDTFHYAARYANISTLEVLTASSPESVDTSVRADCGKSVQEAAEWRRDFNEQWSIKYTQTPDEDPKAWFAAFECMVKTIQARQPNSGTPFDSEEDHLTEDYYSSEESLDSTPDEDEQDD